MAQQKGRQVQTAILLPADVMSEIEALATFELVSRADIIRRWLMIGRAEDADKVAQAMGARREVA